MKIVQSAAHVWVCSCGEHGHIVMPDGTQLPDFWSKKIARSDVESVLGRIVPENAKLLYDQIEKSRVPEDDCGLTLGKRAEEAKMALSKPVEITLYICSDCQAHGNIRVNGVAQSECVTRLALRRSLAETTSKWNVPPERARAIAKEIDSCPLPDDGNTFELTSYALTYHNLQAVNNRLMSSASSLFSEGAPRDSTKH